MKKVLLLGIILASVVADSVWEEPIKDPRCPEKIQDGGRVSHPNYCNKYLLCSYGWGYGRLTYRIVKYQKINYRILF